MGKIVRYVGLDVHKDTIVIAVADGRGPAQQLATLPHDWVRLVQQLEQLGPPARLRLCYEAGPTRRGRPGSSWRDGSRNRAIVARSWRRRWCQCVQESG